MHSAHGPHKKIVSQDAGYRLSLSSGRQPGIEEDRQKATSPVAIFERPVQYMRATIISASQGMSGEALNRRKPVFVGATGRTRPASPNVASSFDRVWDTAISSMTPRS